VDLDFNVRHSRKEVHMDMRTNKELLDAYDEAVTRAQQKGLRHITQPRDVQFKEAAEEAYEQLKALRHAVLARMDQDTVGGLEIQ
jgi:hypothetical protein